MTTLQTATAKVRGLGATGHGTDHFWRQRVSALANIFLVGGVAIALFKTVGAPYDQAIRTIGHPWTALLFVLFASNAAYHMNLGLRVVIEDYIHKHATKWLLLVLTGFYAALTAAVLIFGVLLIAL